MSNDEGNELDQGIREVFADGDVGRHPSNEELAAYASGELMVAEAERLQGHLGPCRQCTAAVLALEFPCRDETAPDRLSDVEVAAGVEAIVARTGARRIESRSRALLAVAAVLAVACLSLALFATRLERQVGKLEDSLSRIRVASTLPAADPRAIGPPQTGVPIVDLYPASLARGEATEPRAIALPGDAAMVALILIPPSGSSHDAYALRIVDVAGVELWHGPARPNEAGAFVVVLPRRFVEARPERIMLYGLEGTAQRLVEEYRTRFEL